LIPEIPAKVIGSNVCILMPGNQIPCGTSSANTSSFLFSSFNFLFLTDLYSYTVAVASQMHHDDDNSSHSKDLRKSMVIVP